MEDRNLADRHGPAAADEKEESRASDATSDPRQVCYCTPSGPTNVQEIYRAFKREDLVGIAAKAAHATKCDIGRLGYIGTALAGSRLPSERRLGHALLHIASAEDVYARCALAQEYARGGDLPQDLDFSERLFRSVVADVPADHAPLGSFARRALADLLVVLGRAEEAKALWQEIASVDKEAAYLAGRASEQEAVASGSDSELERVAHYYRLAAISGHAAAMLALAQLLTSKAGTTQAAREEAQLWTLRAAQDARRSADAASSRAAARNEE